MRLTRMTAVEIVSVDERDSNWEDHSPRFRVYLHSSGGSTTRGGTATYDVTGADALQVIDWAQRRAGNTHTFAVALVYDDRAEEALNPGRGRGLVWLVGMDGNDDPTSEEEVDAQTRMLLRRGDPVIVPHADQIPPGHQDLDNDGAVPTDRA